MVLFWPPSLFYVSFYSKMASQEQVLKHGKELQYLDNHLEVLLINNLGIEGCRALSKAYSEGLIAGYSLDAESVNCREPEALDLSLFQITGPNKIHSLELAGDHLSYKLLESDNNRAFIVAKNIDVKSLVDFVKQSPASFLRGFLIDTAIAIWLVFALWSLFILRNIEGLRKIYRKNHGSPFWFKLLDQVASWIEDQDGVTIQNIHATNKKQLNKLIEERSYYSETLEYTLISELKDSAKDIQFPYRFKGTVARVDINGYGQYIYEGNRPYLLEMKKVFEWTAAECAYRYQGLFEGRAGDMVVYVFRGLNAEKRAAAFVRDFSLEFSSHKFDFLHHKSVTLFVKASIATSDLVMEASPSKYDFDGDALYLTDRMFGELEEEDKKKNVLVLFPSDSEGMKEIVKKAYASKTISRKEATLTVSYFDNFYEFTEKPDQCEFHLGDTGLRQQIEFVCNSSASEITKTQIVQKLLGTLRVKRVHEELSKTWLNSLDYLLKNKSDQTKLIASFISLGREVVPVKNWIPLFSETIVNAKDLLDDRSKANAIELLAFWNDLTSVNAIFIGEMGTDSYRLRANYILSHGLVNPTEKTFSEIIEMIQDGDERLQDSGLYAAATLIISLQEKDISELVTFKGYHELIKVMSAQTPSSERLKAFIDKVNVEI